MAKVKYGTSDVNSSATSVESATVANKTNMSPKKLNISATSVIMFLATVAIISGMVWFFVQNNTRYSNVQGHVMKETVTVSSVTKQTDTEEQEGAIVTLDRYHLTAKYNNADLVLKEGYIDSELANSMIGQKRVVPIDSVTLNEVIDSGITMWFTIPLFIGLFLYLCVGLIYLKK